ncbi:hypothetical protein Trydic_g23092 [Trypoxylus dichotomus]
MNEHGTSSSRLLARQYLVPLLLGFKFNIASLVPIIFGIIALFISKVAIVSKVALIGTIAYALSNLVFNNYGNSCSGNYYQPTLNPAFGGHYDFKYKNEDNPEVYLRSKRIFGDQVRLHGSIPVDEVFTREDKETGRNFAWSEDEYKKKT